LNDSTISARGAAKRKEGTAGFRLGHLMRTEQMKSPDGFIPVMPTLAV